MRVPFLALSWGLGTMLALQSPVHAQVADSPFSVSIERIRAGLSRPPPLLQVTAPSGDIPTFRTEVRAPFGLQPTDERPFDPTFGLPSVGELLMNGIEKVRSAAVRYKRQHARGRARKEVDDALAAFCAIRECSTPNSAQ